ncbi:MAG: MoaD/ThiS family protein [Archaeoglobales archaeon]|nr:MoaD/ThiS family protein [Archaeoglobales archaeon]
MKIKILLSALQFRNVIAYENRCFYIDLDDQSTIKDAVLAIENKIGGKIEHYLTRGDVKLILNDRVIDYKEEMLKNLKDEDVLIFITPLSGG